jgi:hypothetical protein
MPRAHPAWIRRPLEELMRLVLAAAIIALSFLSLAPASAWAGGVPRPHRAAEVTPDGGAAVTGRVVDPAGNAVAGITVLAARADRGPLRRAKSDRDGVFRFALPPGEYVFLALDHALAGATPAMSVQRSLAVTLTVERDALSA